MTTRRQLLKGAGGLGVLAALSACGGTGPAASTNAPSASSAASAANATAQPAPTAAPLEKELVFSSRGGSLGDIFKSDIVAPFEQKFGVKVTYVAGDSTPGYAKVVAEKANPQTDVFWSTAQTHAQGVQAGIFDKLDPKVATSLNDMYSWARYPDDFGAMFSVGAVAPEYNTQIYTERGIPKPASWNDLLSPAAKGHIVLMDLTTLQGLTSFLMINKIAGGSEKNVDPGFAAIKARLGDILAIVSSPAQVDELLQQKSAWITSNQVARAYVLKDAGVPVDVAVVKEGLPLVELPLDLVKGAPHPRAAQAFINWCIGKESQTVVGNKMALGPGSKLATLDAKAATRNFYVTDPNANLVKFDFQAINAGFASWTERWNKEFAK